MTAAVLQSKQWKYRVICDSNAGHWTLGNSPSAVPTQCSHWKGRSNTVYCNSPTTISTTLKYVSHYMPFVFQVCKTGQRCKCFVVFLCYLLTGLWPVLPKGVMMLGAVGAYAWSGTVVHQKGSNADILPFSAFERTLQDRNHSSLLGRYLHFPANSDQPYIKFWFCYFRSLHETVQECECNIVVHWDVNTAGSLLWLP